MIIDRVWHFYGEDAVPQPFRKVPFELSDADLSALTLSYAVLLYRNDDKKTVLALDTPRGRFHPR